ncbi:MAG: four helix bundle protein [Patescibacteria group bacterium]
MQKEKVKDLKKRAFIFSVEIIGFVEKLSKDRTVYIINDQLLRSATSIGANIIEAQSASSRKDFANFYHFALKSANETKYWLMLLLYTKKCTDKLVRPLLNELDQICKILAKSILTLKGK